MRPLIQEIVTSATPESLCEELFGVEGLVLLRTALFDDPRARYSFVTAQPFLTFRSVGSRCEIASQARRQTQFGNPWRLLDALMSRYELLEEIDLPFPLGGCFGYWGYDLKNFVEPRLTRTAVNDLELPDCHVGFYDSVVVFDHRLSKTWIVSTGLTEDGSRSAKLAQSRLGWWQERLRAAASSQSCEGSRTHEPGKKVYVTNPLTPHPGPLPVEGRGRRGGHVRKLLTPHPSSLPVAPKAFGV